MTTAIKTYVEMLQLRSFEDRFAYLALRGAVGRETFGFDRWLNQRFYTSQEWRRVRNAVLVRDLGCDLGIADREIHDRILIHHMNPISPEDIKEGNDDALLDPNVLITVRHNTHNALHYLRGDEHLLTRMFTPRRPGDTDLWRRANAQR